MQINNNEKKRGELNSNFISFHFVPFHIPVPAFITCRGKVCAYINVYSAPLLSLQVQKLDVIAFRARDSHVVSKLSSDVRYCGSSH